MKEVQAGMEANFDTERQSWAERHQQTMDRVQSKYKDIIVKRDANWEKIL